MPGHTSVHLLLSLECPDKVQACEFCFFSSLLFYCLTVVCLLWVRDQWDTEVEQRKGGFPRHAGAFKRKTSCGKNGSSLKWRNIQQRKTLLPASDTINWFVVKATAVALTFPVTAQMYWFINHLLKDWVNNLCPVGKKYVWYISVGPACDKYSSKSWAHHCVSNPVTACVVLNHCKQIQPYD